MVLYLVLTKERGLVSMLLEPHEMTLSSIRFLKNVIIFICELNWESFSNKLPKQFLKCIQENRNEL
jgi:hypothetical protein